MITSRRIAIGGAQMDAVDESIVIRSIQAKGGKDTISTATPYGRPGGQRITGQHRDTLDLQVSFAIRMKKSRAAERSQILEKITAWAYAAADGAWITTNQKPGRRLWARVAQWPEEGDMRQWTNEYTLVFRAYEIPWWQNTQATTWTRSGASSGSISATIPGSAKTVLDITFTNTSGSACDSITINTGAAKVTFSGLGLASGAAFTFGHDSKGRITARAGGSSCLAKMATGSNDDLIIEPGARTITFSASVAGTFVASCYGRYA